MKFLTFLPNKKMDINERKKNLKALSKGFHIMHAVDNCKNKFEIQEVLHSLTNISLVKAYHATIDSDHFCCYCFRCRLHNRIHDTLIASYSPEFWLHYSSDFQKLEDLEPYPFHEIYYERIRNKYF